MFRQNTKLELVRRIKCVIELALQSTLQNVSKSDLQGGAKKKYVNQSNEIRPMKYFIVHLNNRFNM